MEHTFVICAYKESVYLEECVKSLEAQSVKSNIIMVTSTENEHIRGVAESHHIPLYIRQGQSNIADDWNFGYSKAKTPYVTIAHQDDVYMNKYTEIMVRKLKTVKTPLIAFCDYGELRNGINVGNNNLLKIKRLLLMPLCLKINSSSKFWRRRCLSLGNPICCPSVTYVKENLPGTLFKKGFSSNIDWEAWEKISKLHGEFVYINEILMCHRIHENSTTTEIIGNKERANEDFAMFCKFWPKWIAKGINRFYAKSEKSNELG